MFEEPDLCLLHVSAPDEGLVGQELEVGEAYERYADLLVRELEALGVPLADVASSSSSIMHLLFCTRPREGAGLCGCSCHPRLPVDAFHDFGMACPCPWSDVDHEAYRAALDADLSAIDGSPEVQEADARRRAEEDALVLWLSVHPAWW